MTELDQFLAMLRRADVTYAETRGDELVTIKVEGGYAGHFTELEFATESGHLLTVGAYDDDAEVP